MKKNIKKIVCLFAALLLVVSIIPVVNASSVKKPERIFLMGDVDGNGKVEPSDARTVLRVSVQLDILDGVETTNVLGFDSQIPTKGQLADIDKDKKISPADARMILRMAVLLDPLVEIIPESSSDISQKIENFIDNFGIRNMVYVLYSENGKDSVSNYYAYNNQLVCEVTYYIKEEDVEIGRISEEAYRNYLVESDEYNDPFQDLVNDLAVYVNNMDVSVLYRLITEKGTEIYSKEYIPC